MTERNWQKQLTCSECPMAEYVNGSALLCLILGWYFIPDQDCRVNSVFLRRHCRRWERFIKIIEGAEGNAWAGLAGGLGLGE